MLLGRTMVRGWTTFSVWTQFTVPTGIRSEHPTRGMTLATRMAVLQASKRVGHNGILDCKFLSKNAHRTARQQRTPAERFVVVPIVRVVLCQAGRGEVCVEGGRG
jgi:hypothetical protein